MRQQGGLLSPVPPRGAGDYCPGTPWRPFAPAMDAIPLGWLEAAILVSGKATGSAYLRIALLVACIAAGVQRLAGDLSAAPAYPGRARRSQRSFRCLLPVQR